jgi:hypothetical protein
MQCEAQSSEVAISLERRIRIFIGRLPCLREVAVQVEGDFATIAGRVRSFDDRDICIECCRRVAGVRHICDQLEITDAAGEEPERAILAWAQP